MKYDDETAAVMAKINRDVNAGVEYETDEINYGLKEYWEIAGRRGDCEDSALLKRKLLIDAGFPPRDLNIGICYVKEEGHAVLVVRFDNSDDYVLDINTDRPVIWWNFHCRWLEVSVDGDFRKWVKVDV